MTARIRPADLGTPPALMSEAYAAAYLSVSAGTVRRLAEDPGAGFPSPVRIGARRLYRRAEIEAWVLSLPAEREEVEDAERCRADEAFG